MVQPTLANELHRYEIAGKLRSLRLKKKLGLVELGRHTGLSPALLSKLERGKMFPTLPTLLRIALVFSVGLDFFFAGGRDKPLLAVVRKSQRVKLPEQPGARDLAYRFEYLAGFESSYCRACLRIGLSYATLAIVRRAADGLLGR